MAGKCGGVIALVAAVSLEGCVTARAELASAAHAREEQCDPARAIAARAEQAAALVPPSPQRPDIERRVQHVLQSVLEISPEEAVDSADLVCDAKADSLEIVEVVMALEEEFGISIPDEDAERHIWSFDKIVVYIEGRSAEAGRA